MKCRKMGFEILLRFKKKSATIQIFARFIAPNQNVAHFGLLHSTLCTVHGAVWIDTENATLIIVYFIYVFLFITSTMLISLSYCFGYKLLLAQFTVCFLGVIQRRDIMHKARLFQSQSASCIKRIYSCQVNPKCQK